MDIECALKPPVKAILTLSIAVIFITSCGSREMICSDVSLTQSEVIRAAELIKNSLIDTYGERSAGAILRTFSIAKTQRCNRIVEITYFPNPGVFGSEHVFQIDFETNAIVALPAGD